MFQPTDCGSSRNIELNYLIVEVLINKTFGFGIDKHKFIEKIYNFNEKSILNRIDDQWDFCEKDSQQPQWAFFHISINGELYYGNAGLHTKHLGNVLEMSYDEIYDKIADKSANYDYSAYYEIKRLPSVDEILNYAKSSNLNYIFSDIESCIYYWLDKMNVRSILL